MLRLFAGYTRVSLINIVVAICMYFVNVDHLSTYVLFIVVGSFLLKVAEITLTNKLISIRESRRTSKGWDGLPTSMGNYPSLIRTWH